MSAKSSRPQRSLTDIRTVAGKSSDPAQRGYANYFEMGALELERLRRTQEREAAQRRIDEINRRIAEIDAEMVQLQTAAEASRADRAATAEGGGAGTLPRQSRVSRRRGAAAGTAEGGAVTVRGGVARAEPNEAGERRGMRIRY
jgi:hypothetical protein